MSPIRSRLSIRVRGRLFAFLVVVAVLVAGGGVAGAQPAAPRPQRGQASEPVSPPTDQIIIRFDQATTASALSAIDARSAVRLMDQLSAAAGVELTLDRRMSEGAFVLKLPEKFDIAQVERFSRSLEAQPGVELAEPDHIVRIAADPARGDAPAAGEATPNDPQFDNQWHYRYTDSTEEGINLLPAWDITTGSAGVIVAVIDTGILAHADLAGRTVPGYDFIGDTFVSNDGDGRDNDPSDPGDWVTAADNCGYTSNSSWHGSHVAGTIGSGTNNGIGGSGVTWSSKILPVRVLGKCGGYVSDVLDGVSWAAGLAVPGVPANPNKADVINMSLGGQRLCSAIEQDVYNAVRNAGVAVVAAAGNSAQNVAFFSPANCNNVVAVAATNKVGNYAWYSNYGNAVDVSAPGGETDIKAEGVLSTVSNGTTVPTTDAYKYYQGTSMAAPHVAGVAALILSVAPDLTPAEIEQHLKDTARPFPDGSGCTVADCGDGIVDAFRALDGLVDGPPPAPALISPVDGATVTDATPMLDWSDADGAGSYRLQVATDTGFNDVVIDVDVVASTYTPAAPLANDQYVWRVRSVAGALESEWSSAWSFTVQFCATPAKPALSFPKDGATLGDATPTLTWAAVDDSVYDVVVDDNADLSSPLFTTALGTTSVIVSPPLPLGNYYWAVRARNEAGGCNQNGGWSDTWSFSVADVELYEIAIPAVLR